MELKRRAFMVLLLTAAAGLLAAGRRLAHDCAPSRVLHALRAKRYPGPVVQLDSSEVRKPSRWLG